ncbi:MAG: hypothetical protein FXF47_08845 [Candidatus Mcinerneyibacterium aminivorans]|uniref:6-bladed beta-propeller n=1 Tax=Candidatus Mcinerneyibacterium aminivorans TaxID=2703815 RepID=A0A5D0MFZ4_9BACT|nr:MAG: hypothetical protein FXF47_08845 [Candidatus Mcinerneyibacterium aminivorans]
MDIMSLNGFSIKNNKIYTYDSNLKRISIFNFNGKNLDVINLNNYISDLSISKNKIFITGFIKTNLEVIDLKTGNQIKKIKYAEIEKLIDRGYGKMGPICYDKNSKKIYRGYWEEPYRIKIYNRDIKLKNVIKKDLDHNITEFERTENKGFIGKFLIKDLAIYKDYLVALEGSCGYIDDKKRKWRIDKFKINVFNKNTGKYIYEITNDKLSNLGAFINGIIDINNKYIIFELKQIKETNKLLDIKTDSALIFVENPLNNYEQKNN